MDRAYAKRLVILIVVLLISWAALFALLQAR